MPYVPEPSREYKPDQLSREFEGIKTELDLIRERVVNAVPWKAFYLKVFGNGASDPTVENEFNIDTVTRVGAGLYRVTLTVAVIGTTEVLAEVYPSFQVAVAVPIIDTEYYVAELMNINSPAGIFDIQVWGFFVPNNGKLTLVEYDLLAADRLWMFADLNLGTGTPQTSALAHLYEVS